MSFLKFWMKGFEGILRYAALVITFLLLSTTSFGAETSDKTPSHTDDPLPQSSWYQALTEVKSVPTNIWERMKLAAPDAIVMHPGPMNRGIEIESELADSSQSAITWQVQNGVAVRMAVLATVLESLGAR
jgi:hypothetical protein